MNKVYCPILGREIDEMECYDASLVFEEVSPVSELPDGIDFTDDNQKICLKCSRHPN